MEDLLNHRLREKQHIEQINNESQQRQTQSTKLLPGNILSTQNTVIQRQVPSMIQSHIPQSIRVIQQQPIIMPHKAIIHQIRPSMNSLVTVRPQPVFH